MYHRWLPLASVGNRWQLDWPTLLTYVGSNTYKLPLVYSSDVWFDLQFGFTKQMVASERERGSVSQCHGQSSCASAKWTQHCIVGQKILKNPGPKNLWNQINQFHEILFWQKYIFCNFKNDQKSFFELEKSLKLPEMQFHIKKNLSIWFHEFFLPGLF